MKIFKILTTMSLIYFLFPGISAAYDCPDYQTIKTTPFAPPSYVWIAPAMPSSTYIGSGVGTKIPGPFIKAEYATVDDHPGWVCWYHSSSSSVTDLYKIKDKLPKEFKGMVDRLAAQGDGIGMIFYQSK